MAGKISKMEWIARIGGAIIVLGALFLIIPYICVASPFLINAGLLMGLIVFASSYKNENLKNANITAIVDIVLGVLFIILFAVIYITEWSIWG